MSTSRAGVVVDALVTALKAALTDADVVDGPAVERPNIGRSTLYIGWSGEEGNNLAADAQQEYAGIGPGVRNEELTIICRAHMERGDTDMKPTRDAALTLVAAVENALRSDPHLSGALPAPSYAEFGSVQSLNQLQTEQGSQCGAIFTVTAKARI